MDERNERLIKAAHTTFARYGVGKTTMNDIAQEAGVARQTLYNAYPSKEAVLRATVRYSVGKTFETVEAEWEGQSTLAEQLEAYFVHGPLAWYDLLQASPHAADLIDGIHTIAKEELAELSKQWNARLAALIRSHVSEGSKAYASAAETADFIYSTSTGAKQNAADRSVVEARLGILKLAVLAMLNDDASQS